MSEQRMVEKKKKLEEAKISRIVTKAPWNSGQSYGKLPARLFSFFKYTRFSRSLTTTIIIPQANPSREERNITACSKG